MKTNDKNLTAEQYLNQFNKGGGKTAGNTAPKIDVANTNIPALVRDMPEEFRVANLSYLVWKENNYRDIEGDSKDYLINGWFGKKHYDAVEAPVEVKNPLERPNKVLTAEEYRINCIKLNLMNADVSVFDALLSVDGAASTTKDKLLGLIHDLQTVLFTDEQKGVYEVMLEKEEQEKAKFKNLLDAGFTDITAISSGYVASINAIGITTPIPETLGKNGYVLTNSEYNPVSMVITVFFAEKTEETQVKPI